MPEPEISQPAIVTRKRRSVQSIKGALLELLSEPVCRVRGPKRISRIPPSAARKSHAPSSGFEHQQQHQPLLQATFNVRPLEDRTDLPNLPDLLDELEADVDVNSLEQLTQSLLQDIARDLEAAVQKADCHEPDGYRQDSVGEVVGQASTQLESSRCEVLTDENSSSSLSSQADDNTKNLENDISEYLLLHHNYAAKPPATSNTKKAKKPSTRNKFKAIRPKSDISNTVKAPVEIIDASTTVVLTENNEVLCGTLDSDANVVTIFVDDTSTPVSDTMPELLSVETDRSKLGIATGGASPMSNISDRGYESLDSPNSTLEEDIWDTSISELFPSLM